MTRTSKCESHHLSSITKVCSAAKVLTLKLTRGLLSVTDKAQLESRGLEALGHMLLPSECSQGLLLSDKSYRSERMLSAQIFKVLIFHPSLNGLHFTGLTLFHVLQVREAEGRLLWERPRAEDASS